MMSDLYFEIVKKMEFDREQLIENYAYQITDSMDSKTMFQFVYDTVLDNLKNYSDDELITEVEETYPELLEDYDMN